MSDNEWKPIATAPEGERVMVCGWQHGAPSINNRLGYWWWHEDVIFDGRAVGYPYARYWCSIVLPPFPASKGG